MNKIVDPQKVAKTMQIASKSKVQGRRGKTARTQSGVIGRYGALWGVLKRYGALCGGGAARQRPPERVHNNV